MLRNWKEKLTNKNSDVELLAGPMVSPTTSRYENNSSSSKVSLPHNYYYITRLSAMLCQIHSLTTTTTVAVLLFQRRTSRDCKTGRDYLLGRRRKKKHFSCRDILAEESRNRNQAVHTATSLLLLCEWVTKQLNEWGKRGFYAPPPLRPGFQWKDNFSPLPFGNGPLPTTNLTRPYLKLNLKNC